MRQPTDLTEPKRIVEKIGLLTDVLTELEQIEAGQEISNRQAKTTLKTRFSKLTSTSE